MELLSTFLEFMQLFFKLHRHKPCAAIGESKGSCRLNKDQYKPSGVSRKGRSFRQSFWSLARPLSFAARKLRNALVHAYMQDTQSFLESLLTAQVASQMLFDVILHVEAELQRLGVIGL